MKENEMMEVIVNALILFVSVTLLFIWLDRTVSLKVRQMVDQVDEKYAQKVMILPLKEKPQIELTETEMKLRKHAKGTPEKHYQTTDLRNRTPLDTDAGLGSGTSSERLDVDKESLQQNETLIYQTDPGNPYFSEGCGISR